MRINIGNYSLGKKKIALVLSSGSARGWAHVGVINALEEARIPIDIVVGASAGSIVGTFYAANAIDSLLKYAAKHKSKRNTYSYIDFSWAGGVLKGDKFVRFLMDNLPVRRFDQLKKKMGIVASDIAGMQEIHITKGFLIPAIRASVAVPTAFSPLSHEKRQLVDGGLLNPIPVNLARYMKADFVIAVDLDNTVPYLHVKTPLDAFYRSLWTMTTRITLFNLKIFPPDVLIHPDLNHFGYTDYHRTIEAIEIGYETTRELTPMIKEKLANFYYKSNKHYNKSIPAWYMSFTASISFTYDMELNNQKTKPETQNWLKDLSKLPPQLFHNFFHLDFFKYPVNLAKVGKERIVTAYKEIRKTWK